MRRFQWGDGEGDGGDGRVDGDGRGGGSGRKEELLIIFEDSCEGEEGERRIPPPSPRRIVSDTCCDWLPFPVL